MIRIFVGERLFARTNDAEIELAQWAAAQEIVNALDRDGFVNVYALTEGGSIILPEDASVAV